MLDVSADETAQKGGNTHQEAVAESISPAEEEPEGTSCKQAVLLCNWMISGTLTCLSAKGTFLLPSGSD